MLRNHLEEAIKKNANFCCLLACVCIMTTHSPSNLERDSRFILNFEALHRPPYSDLTPRDVRFLASKRLCMRKWTSLQIPRKGEGGGSYLVGTAPKNFLSRGMYALVEPRRWRVERGRDWSKDRHCDLSALLYITL